MTMKETKKISKDYSVKISINSHNIIFPFISKDQALNFFFTSTKKIALKFIKNKTCYFSSVFYYKEKKLIEENLTLLIRNSND